MSGDWPLEADRVYGCELWTGALNNNGRPIIWRGQRPLSAIREAFTRTGIEIPADKVPDHLCRRIRCVSLEHLELVTKHENERRKSLRYRLARRTCRRGHSLTEVTRMVTPEMGVLCRQCMKEPRTQQGARAMEPKPSIGRIVHFFPHGSTTPEAALVVAVHSDSCVNVSACNSGGTWHSETSVLQGDAADTSRARWCWPARV